MYGLQPREKSTSAFIQMSKKHMKTSNDGINFISSKYIDSFIKRLEECDDNDYFERALEVAIEKDDFKIKPVDISEFNCIEIDFEEDLKNANNLI